MGFLASLFLMLDATSLNNIATAYQTTCPETMSDQDCLQFLQEQATQISEEKKNLNKKISEEEYAQLSLYGQIDYYTSQIASTEATIKQLELEIESNSVEIKILTKEIEALQNEIDTASQEIDRLEQSIKETVALSYKFSTTSPLELLFSLNDFDSLSRQIQYLKKTRERDQDLLNGMSEQRAKLSEEKQTLADRKVKVQDIRDQSEIKKSELFNQKANLSKQKSEQQVLLAESKSRQVEYETKFAKLKKVEDEITSVITQAILRLFNEGQIPTDTPVKKGDIVGFQGHTGVATASHLHMGINYGALDPFGSGYFTGGALGQPVGSGLANQPLAGGVLTQSYHCSGGLVVISLIS